MPYEHFVQQQQQQQHCEKRDQNGAVLKWRVAHERGAIFNFRCTKSRQGMRFLTQFRREKDESVGGVGERQTKGGTLGQTD